MLSGASDIATAPHHRIRTIREGAVWIEAAVVLHDAAGQIGVGCFGRVLKRLTNVHRMGTNPPRDEEQERRERVVERACRLDVVADSAAGAANVCHRGG